MNKAKEKIEILFFYWPSSTSSKNEETSGMGSVVLSNMEPPPEEPESELESEEPDEESETEPSVPSSASRSRGRLEEVLLVGAVASTFR